MQNFKDIDSSKLNSFEGKVGKIWEDNTIDSSKKYQKIFELFFADFCKKFGDNIKVEAKVGNWIQGVLERLALMNIPISTFLRDTATVYVRPELAEKRQFFNKELTSRETGALSVLRYLDTRIKKFDDYRACTQDTLDLNFKIDLIEIPEINEGEIPTLYLTQVKSKKKMTADDIAQIQKKHISYLKFLRMSEQGHLKNEQETHNQREERLNQGGDEIDKLKIDIQMLIIEHITENENTPNYENIVAEISKVSRKDKDDIWIILNQLEEEATFAELIPIIEYAREHHNIVNADSVYSKFSIIPSRCNRIVSRIIHDDRVLIDLDIDNLELDELQT